jgi:hypothetical protein
MLQGCANGILWPILVYRPTFIFSTYYTSGATPKIIINESFYIKLSLMFGCFDERLVSLTKE